MTCKYCRKSHIDEIDMHNDEMCDDCFDLMMEREELDFKIYHNQQGKCKLCGQELSGWIVVDDKAICWPSCIQRLDPPIKLELK